MTSGAIYRGQRAVLATLVLFGLMLSIGCGSDAEKRERLKAGEAFLAAQKATKAGNPEEAIQILSDSLVDYPSSWSYFERAKLYLDADRIDEALADCDAALELQSNHVDAEWLKGEIKKPADKRFKGRFAEPPSAGK